MDANASVVLAFVLFGVLLAIGVPIAVSLMLAGLAGFLMYQGNPGYLPLIPYGTLNSFILTAIPLFIFMGEIMGRCGTSDMIYTGTSKLLSWVPGGLLHSNIAACALFAAISGSSPATAATIGSVAIPRMKERGYDLQMLLGSVAAGGSLGILIPPSITMIIYGSLSQASVGALFAGGVVPGIILTVWFMIYIGIRSALQPRLAPPAVVSSRRELVEAAVGMWPLAVIGIVVLGGIFGGFMTPTEAAALGSAVAILIGVVLRRMTWQVFRESVIGAVKTSAMVLFILAGAFIFAGFLATTRVPAAMATYVAGLGWSVTPILIAIFALYIFLGCFIDPGSIMVVTLPAILPMLHLFGLDLIWFGVVAVVLSQVGMITPPMGLNLFVVQGVAGSELDTVVKGIVPFFFIMLLCVALLVAFPVLVLWLPTSLGL